MAELDFSIMDEFDYETFVSIIADIPSCIFFKDTSLKYRFCTHHWKQLNSGDIIGKTDVEIRKDTENAIEAMEADRVMIENRKGCSYVIKCEIEDELSYFVC